MGFNCFYNLSLLHRTLLNKCLRDLITPRRELKWQFEYGLGHKLSKRNCFYNRESLVELNLWHFHKTGGLNSNFNSLNSSKNSTKISLNGQNFIFTGERRNQNLKLVPKQETLKCTPTAPRCNVQISDTETGTCYTPILCLKSESRHTWLAQICPRKLGNSDDESNYSPFWASLYLLMSAFWANNHTSYSPLWAKYELTITVKYGDETVHEKCDIKWQFEDDLGHKISKKMIL